MSWCADFEFRVTQGHHGGRRAAAADTANTADTCRWSAARRQAAKQQQARGGRGRTGASLDNTEQARHAGGTRGQRQALATDTWPRATRLAGQRQRDTPHEQRGTHDHAAAGCAGVPSGSCSHGHAAVKTTVGRTACGQLCVIVHAPGWVCEVPITMPITRSPSRGPYHEVPITRRREHRSLRHRSEVGGCSGVDGRRAVQ